MLFPAGLLVGIGVLQLLPAPAAWTRILAAPTAAAREALGPALGGMAGLMVGVYYGQINFTMGWIYGLKAFTAAILGGIGNIPGAMLGGLLLGVIEAMGDGTGAIMLDGKMEDDASCKQCHVVVELAKQLSARDPELADRYGF